VENTSVKVLSQLTLTASHEEHRSKHQGEPEQSVSRLEVYYFENGTDIKQAYEWASAAAATNPDAYWMSYQKQGFRGNGRQTRARWTPPWLQKAAAEKEKNRPATS